MSKDVTTTKITILIDNKGQNTLFVEHGFSLLIETADKHILFDTGQSSLFAKNAEKLGIDLSKVNIIALSHGHYDHTGGLPAISTIAPSAKIFAHLGVTTRRFSFREDRARSIGITSSVLKVLENHPGKVHWISKHENLTSNIGLTGEVPRLTEYEDTGGLFFLDEQATQLDPISDDMSLWILSKEGLIVIAGCSHSGIINTLKYIMEISGERRLHMVLGGFHLVEADDEKTKQTILDLKKLNPNLLVPCHCTGDSAVEKLKCNFGDRVVQGEVGAVFEIEI